MKKLTVVLFIVCLVLGYLYLSGLKKTGVQSTIYEDSISVLYKDIETLKTSEIELTEIIEGARLMVGDKDRQLSDLKDEFEHIKNNPIVITRVITDTVEYIQDCEKSKLLLTNSLEQVDVLESKVLILEDIVTDQVHLLGNLKTQNKKLSEIIEHKNAIIEIEIAKGKRKGKRGFMIGLGAGYVAGLLTPI